MVRGIRFSLKLTGFGKSQQNELIKHINLQKKKKIMDIEIL